MHKCRSTAIIRIPIESDNRVEFDYLIGTNVHKFPFTLFSLEERLFPAFSLAKAGGVAQSDFLIGRVGLLGATVAHNAPRPVCLHRQPFYRSIQLKFYHRLTTFPYRKALKPGK